MSEQTGIGTPEPYMALVSQDAIDEVKARLSRTRWPKEQAELPAWELGADMEYMRRLCHHWEHEYDWRGVESRINGFDNFKVAIDGIDIHYILEKGSGENPFPVILTHGWPGSFLEFLDVIERLAHPERFGGKAEDGVDVIVPSLPGYGFSGMAANPINARDVAGMWRRLMVDVLGYDRFGAQGGDWGSLVTAWLGLDHGDVCQAVHLNMLIVRPDLKNLAHPLDEEEKAWVARHKGSTALETGYQLIQATKPQTLAYGLTDSPAGLAAWIAEKFHGWGDVKGDISARYSFDQLLDNIALYWFTRTINTSTWMYRSIVASKIFVVPAGQKIEVPTGIGAFQGDIFTMPPRQWVERIANVVHWSEYPDGGHFAAFAEPEAFASEVTAFFSTNR